jgi:hypothetical protein
LGLPGSARYFQKLLYRFRPFRPALSHLTLSGADFLRAVEEIAVDIPPRRNIDFTLLERPPGRRDVVSE